MCKTLKMNVVIVKEHIRCIKKKQLQIAYNEKDESEMVGASSKIKHEQQNVIHRH